MKNSNHVTVRAPAKAVAPVLAVLALSVVAFGGSGLAAGALLSATFVLHALVSGAERALRAVPPFAWRIAALLALLGAGASACAPDWAYAARIGEGALAAAVVAAVGLAFTALAARAPTLRDEDWQ